MWVVNSLVRAQILGRAIRAFTQATLLELHVPGSLICPNLSKSINIRLCKISIPKANNNYSKTMVNR